MCAEAWWLGGERSGAWRGRFVDVVGLSDGAAAGSVVRMCARGRARAGRVWRGWCCVGDARGARW